MKEYLIASMQLTAAMFTASAERDAHTTFRLCLGVPHYPYRVGPDYVFRPVWGWYHPARGRISRQWARDIFRSHGYRNVDRLECNGPAYTFRGTRGGNRFVVHVNARTGGT